MLVLNDTIEKISRVGGAVYLKKLKQLDVNTVQDLLFYFPYRYDDFSDLVLIKDAEIAKKLTIKGKILKISNIRTFKRRMSITECLIEDSSGTIKAVWFNQPFLMNTLKTGQIVNFSGKLAFRNKEAYISNPSYEIIGLEGGREKLEINHTARLVPVYPETKGLSSRRLRYLIRPILALADKIPDYLPENIKTAQNLLSLKDAIKQIHFPQSKIAAEKAKKRLAFDEIFLMQTAFLKEKLKRAQKPAFPVPLDIKLIKKFVGGLPFELTNAQKKSAWRILQDIARPKAMNRLLEGDVGSGKTIVAAIAAVSAAKSGLQTAFMAPTEVLARQHYEKLLPILSPFGFNVAILTGSSLVEEAEKTIREIKNGSAKIIIGTHSLIQDRVKFSNLALVIIDEQHRFGVQQRAKIAAYEPAKTSPHFLSMTATPIPRTLALSIYGDLDISRIDEMPKNRRKIITKIVSPRNRQLAYNFIKQQINNERQAFVICPRIETEDAANTKTSFQKLLTAEIKAVKQEHQKLSKEIFPDLKIGLLHGKLKPKEKDLVMKQFSLGIIDILVSTSVVEVGVDVPNATVMMIEGADRFGLAQLHQFRGRVGRSEHQSYCLLFTDSPAQTTNKRLAALVKYEDGFVLAEKDLALRGAGDFYGSKQWGLPSLKMASLSDLPLIQAARKEAAELLKKDPQLAQHPLLKEKLATFKEKIHFE